MKVICQTLLLCLLASPAFSWPARCVGVSDGDTITVRADGQSKTRIRLYGIDAPESKQDFGRRAKEHLSGLVFGEVVEIEDMGADRYGRTVAVVRVGDINANEEMLKAGMAWVFTKNCRNKICVRWRDLEAQTRAQRVGLWSQPEPVAPWMWREQRRKKITPHPEAGAAG